MKYDEFKMVLRAVIVWCSIIYVNAHAVGKQDDCTAINCVGVEYQCLNGNCYCAAGYIVNAFQSGCVKCPTLGQKCYRTCCSDYSNSSLYCWQGNCRQCYDSYGNWICRDSIDQVLLVSISQIAMATALILGILATFVLLYKLCTTTEIRPQESPRATSRLSIGSLQLYVNERLRDAPPRYSRTAPVGSTVYPAASYLNAGFVHDSSLPPPPYTPNAKNTDASQSEIHM